MHFIKRMKSVSIDHNPPELFVCTVDNEMQTRADLSALGVRRIFLKPYNANEMLQSVREIFWCAGGEAGTEAMGRPLLRH